MKRAEDNLSAAQLLAFLRARGGQEYSVTLVPSAASASRKRAGLRDVAVPAPEHGPPIYRLTLRGQMVQATGPAGLTRQLPHATFLQVFAAQRFADIAPTGELSDLGPLFAAL